ncbi:MAG: dTMP kinase [Pseudomonadota bacterium]|nr:dTMP kinase [Pseudomonadota bacterium]|tara:strand:- start:3650 stop:4273 length:624 start_codon:yes stop_codon:yes gene_type:complete
MTKAKFIVFEGNEGTGKSTHIDFTSDYLTKNNIKHIVTREPGGTPAGESIRKILLDNKSNLDPFSESLLFYASRIINYHSVILKALDNGKSVICDRFHYSTLVYQGLSKINQNVINLHKSLDKYFAEKISLIFYLDADIDTCLSRINRRESSDKFESKGKKFLEKIQKSYSEVFKDNKKAIKVETNQDKDIVNKTIIKNIDKLFNDK